MGHYWSAAAPHETTVRRDYDIRLHTGNNLLLNWECNTVFRPSVLKMVAAYQDAKCGGALHYRVGPVQVMLEEAEHQVYTGTVTHVDNGQQEPLPLWKDKMGHQKSSLRRHHQQFHEQLEVLRDHLHSSCIVHVAPQTRLCALKSHVVRLEFEDGWWRDIQRQDWPLIVSLTGENTETVRKYEDEQQRALEVPPSVYNHILLTTCRTQIP